MAAKKKSTAKKSTARKAATRKATRRKAKPTKASGSSSSGTKRPPGRPRSAMTDENIDRILAAVRLGMFPDRAATMVGVEPSTMRSFRERNEAFGTALEKAEAEAVMGFHGRILRASEEQWTAAAWMLERRWPKEYGKKDPAAVVNLETKGDTSVQVNAGPPIPEQNLGAYMRKLGDLIDAGPSGDGSGDESSNG